jgi:probable HAF family extracellular repeat protein
MLRATVATLACAACALAGMSAHAATAGAAQHTWAAYEIGPMEPGCGDNCDDDITGWSINAKGWVAGDAFPDFHWPWTWREGTTPALLSPGHTSLTNFSNTGFTAINSAGDTAGYADDFEEGGNESHAILRRNGTYRDLGTLESGAGIAAATGLNDSDTVVGVSQTSPSDFNHAFRWTPGGGMVDLGTLGGDRSAADAVNGTNEIVGWANDPAGHQRAFLWKAGTMHDLGTLGGTESEARSINAAGTIVGWADTAAGAQHAFVRAGTTMTDIGKRLNATSSVANDVTNDGIVVGTAQGAKGEFGWLYDHGTITNVTARTVTCCDAVGGSLNKRLQIVPAELTSTTVPVLEPVAADDERSARIHYAGPWARSSRTGDWGGHEKSATRAGATASITFTGKRIWWIATTDPSFGRARVSIDGHVVQTVDLGASFGRARTTVFVHAFAKAGTHTLRVAVLATAGRPRVDIDAFAVSQG